MDRLADAWRQVEARYGFESESPEVAARAVMGIALMLAMEARYTPKFDRDHAVARVSEGTMTGFFLASTRAAAPLTTGTRPGRHAEGDLQQGVGHGPRLGEHQVVAGVDVPQATLGPGPVHELGVTVASVEVQTTWYAGPGRNLASSVSTSFCSKHRHGWPVSRSAIHATSSGSVTP